jgi:hypothetical protein
LTNFQDVWSRAVAGELSWVGPGESPDVLPVVPLRLDGTACVALPYRHFDLVSELREAAEVAFSVTDPGSLPDGQQGYAAIGQVTVIEDIDGTMFAEQLLSQELVKYPPSRALADTALLRREHWWWLPRLVVALQQVDRVAPLPARTEPEAALLVRDGAGLRLDVVRSEDWSADQVALRAATGDPLYGDGAPAIAMGHAYTRPDLERWEPWARRGTLRADVLSVVERMGEPEETLRPLGVWQRVKRHRDLERSCVTGVKRAERARR